MSTKPDQAQLDVSRVNTGAWTATVDTVTMAAIGEENKAHAPC